MYEMLVVVWGGRGGPDACIKSEFWQAITAELT